MTETSSLRSAADTLGAQDGAPGGRPLRRRDGVMVPVLGGVFALLVAWLIYRPERDRPFDVLDFGEFLPILRASSNYWEQTASLIRYYADQSGRANVVQMLALVLKWALFGEWVPGWQLSHALLMSMVAVLAYRFLRRAGATPLGALAGGGVFVLAPSAARSWIRLTVGEPVAMLFVLWTATRAFDFQRTERWGREVTLYCLAAIWVLLVKELMVAVVLIPVTIALTSQANGRFARPGRSRRNRILVASVTASCAVTLVPLAALYINAADTALASQYGATSASAGSIGAIWIATLVPFTPVPATASLAWGAAVVSYVALVAAGWWGGFHDEEQGASARWLLAGSLLVPFLGALAYAPWPAYQERYAYPYLLGTAVLIGLAITYLEQRPQFMRLGAHGLLLPMFVVAASGAWGLAGHADATQRVADAVVATVSARRNVDSVFFASARPYVPAWSGPGPTLSRFGAATGRPWPPTRDVSCDDARELLLRRERAILVGFSSHCRIAAVGASRVLATYPIIDWSQWSLARRSVVAQIIDRSAIADTGGA